MPLGVASPYAVRVDAGFLVVRCRAKPVATPTAPTLKSASIDSTWGR